MSAEPESQPPPIRLHDRTDEPGCATRPEVHPSACSDLANAERFAAQHGGDLLYCYAWKSWLSWNEQRWTRDDGSIVMNRAKQTARSIYLEASRVTVSPDPLDKTQDNIAQGLAEWAKKSESRRNLEAMINLAQSDLPITTDQMDADPWKLNCINQTIELSTGEAREQRREDFITKLAPVEYDPEATCPTWDRFLERVLPDPAVRSFIRRAVGYSLSGSVREQCFFFLYGKGKNGKSVFTEIIESVMGDYAKRLSAQVLMATKNTGGEGNTPEKADLKGMRFVIVSEVQQGSRLNESLIKDLTGGDSITACRKYEAPITFRPTHKIWMYGNHRPTIKGTDEGIKRRPKLIPFTVTIPEKDRDKDLPIKLRQESSGILNWALGGLAEYLQHGLGECEAVETATREYLDDQDLIGQFLKDRCSFSSPEAKILGATLYGAYRAWSETNGTFPLANPPFGESLTERGFQKKRGSEGNLWLGIELL